jgi:hypothetical protein
MDEFILIEGRKESNISTSELHNLLNMPFDSEDDFEEDSDEEEDTTVPTIKIIEMVEEDLEEVTNISVPGNKIEEQEDPTSCQNPPPTSVARQDSCNSFEKTTKKSKKPHNVVWELTDGSDVPQDLVFNCHTLPDTVKDLDSPYDFFKYFISDDLVQIIIDKSIRYSVQKNPNKPFKITSNLIQKYFGVIIISSLLSPSNIRDMWDPLIGNDLIKQTMSLNLFEQIRSILHFNDNDKNLAPNDPKRDKLFKVRPIINHLCQKFLSIPMEQSLSIDEQICATKVKHHLRQYNPRKPKKWGYKLFVLCDTEGYAYKFEIYSGKENICFGNEPDLGANANIVVRLARNIPNFKYHILYFDNFYTSIPLLSFLDKKGILSLGTIRKDRIPNFPFKSEKEDKNLERGKVNEFITKYESSKIHLIRWKDNNFVYIASTLCGVEPNTTIQRFDRKTKTYIDVDDIDVDVICNSRILGCDKSDRLGSLSRYQCRYTGSKSKYRRF